MKLVASLERQGGRVPTIKELAAALGISRAELRSLVTKLMDEEKSDGTSAFGKSLRGILLGYPDNLSKFPGTPSMHKRGQIALFDENNEFLGDFSQLEALAIAHERGLNLFIADSTCVPLLGMLLDSGRYKNAMEKKARVARQRSSSSSVKVLQLRYAINDHDYQIKLDSAKKFLAKGHRVKLWVVLAEREIEHAELAISLLNRFAEDLNELAIWYEDPKLHGKSAVLELSPTL